MQLKSRVDKALEKHALAAQASQYDRSVAISAIASARAVVEDISGKYNSDIFGSQLLAALYGLHSNYNDPDGTYTNGKGVLGSLIGDIEFELSNSKP